MMIDPRRTLSSGETYQRRMTGVKLILVNQDELLCRAASRENREKNTLCVRKESPVDRIFSRKD
ncbi:hypothetical protein X777_08328 [Ooceraea biroi]|uniref:Uncharacterized protein n=1 Tax=Ooceraea biroi TaxID=2015173 RepID=A0A026WZH6_OOCBI|nr:hypothetical protein X777_08328 [Ooceraea biroi]